LATPPTLITDPSKINPAGAEESDLKEYKQSLEEQISSLENRYRNPNWFKVSAGFLKPQLGGFGASLGSAFDAIGENVEQQRASALPIAQMRTQLAQSKIAMGQNEQAAEIYHSHKGPVTEELVKELVRRAPDAPSTKAAQAQLAAQQKRQELTSGSTRDLIAAINAKVTAGLPINKDEKAALESAAKNLLNQPSPKENLPLGNPNVNQSNVPSANQATNLSQAVNPNQPTARPDLTEINKQRDALNAKINNEGYTTENKKLLADLNERRNQVLQGQPLSSQQTTSAQQLEPESNKLYPETVVRPNLEGQLPRRQQQMEEEHTKNADAVRARYEAKVNNFTDVATEPNWSTFKTSVDASIGLIQDHPDIAKKVFNMIRKDGELKNQIMALLNSGVGISVGSFTGSLNIPVESMLRAGINPVDQTYADTLARNMLTIGLARLEAQGVRPEKGSQAFAENLTRKAHLGETPVSASKALMAERVDFNSMKRIHDTVNLERAQGRHNPNSATPIADIYLNSKEIQRIQKDALDEKNQINKDYDDWLKEQKAKSKKRN
jgi:hypothetical protein